MGNRMTRMLTVTMNAGALVAPKSRYARTRRRIIDRYRHRLGVRMRQDTRQGTAHSRRIRLEIRAQARA
eukprot:2683815-Rhodomonas_salina.7